MHGRTTAVVGARKRTVASNGPSFFGRGTHGDGPTPAECTPEKCHRPSREGGGWGRRSRRGVTVGDRPGVALYLQDFIKD